MNSSLFTKPQNGKLTIVLVYVDDLIVTEEDKDEVQRARRNMQGRFQMKDFVELNHFLGIKMERT